MNRSLAIHHILRQDETTRPKHGRSARPAKCLLQQSGKSFCLSSLESSTNSQANTNRPGLQFNKRGRRNDRGDEHNGDEPEQPPEDPLANATTLYVGNLSFYTTEEQVYELFSKCGEIKRLVMGLDRFNKTPCGFCFVEYYTHQDALDCMKYIGGTKLDERIIRTDLDPGFEEGRQYGRGKSGGQVCGCAAGPHRRAHR